MKDETFFNNRVGNVPGSQDITADRGQCIICEDEKTNNEVRDKTKKDAITQLEKADGFLLVSRTEGKDGATSLISGVSPAQFGNIVRAVKGWITLFKSKRDEREQID
jgi:hypothetical protein